MTFEELTRIAHEDPRQIVETYFFIKDKDAHLVPFVFNNLQNYYYENRSNRDIILKARQWGGSSMILALWTVDFLFRPNSWSVCVSHERKSTERLFTKVSAYLKYLPFNVPLDTSRSDMLVNKNNGAMFYIGTAGSKTFGHGDTINNLHLSELSRYPDARELLKGVLNAVPKDGRVVVESTANGFGDHYHKMWEKAQRGHSAFKPLFFGWNMHDEYQNKGVEEGSLILNQEERELKQTYNLKDSQLAWRRDKIKEVDAVEDFQEQFPINDLEAFISSGSPAFDKKALTWYYENTIRKPLFRGDFGEGVNIELVQKDKGYLRIYEKPLPNATYHISADVAKSGDYCSATVWHKGRFEEVANIHGHFEPDYFGRILYKLGRYYGWALLTPEINGLGYGTLAAIKMLEYPNIFSRVPEPAKADQSILPTETLGWLTTVGNRNLMISTGQKSITQKAVIIHDKLKIREMLSFQRNKDGKFEVVESNHGVKNDDRVMDFLIGCMVQTLEPMSENISSRPEDDEVYGEDLETDFT